MRTIKENKWFIFDKPRTFNAKYFIKRVLLPIFDILYKYIIWAKKPKSRGPKKYNLVICGIFKNEEPYLKEWIEHNHNMGVEHFFLYNNFSDDNFSEILRPYIENGLVTLTDWPILQGQMSAYEHFWKNFAAQSQWATFIDIDEFFCPRQDASVANWLEKYKFYPSIVVYWKCFGSSGVFDHDYNKLVTEQYFMCQKMADIGKIIFNTDWNYSKMYHHNINVNVKFLGKNIYIPAVNEFGKFTKWDIHRTSCNPNFSIQLNHYVNKAYNEALNRKYTRGDVYFANRELGERLQGFFINEHHCKIADYTIYRFMIELKLAMGKNRSNE